MTDRFEPPEPADEQPADAPFLPPSSPTVHPTAPPPDSPALDSPALDAPLRQADGAPQLPSIEPPAATPAAEPAVFDAKALVQSQKRSLQHPVYGGIPKATPESAAALEALRAAAQRKRRRNRTIAWLVALLMLAGIAIAGWFAYQAYQDDQDQRAAEQEARQAADSGVEAVVPDALTPLGNQEQVIEVLDELNSGGATPSAGGLAGVVDDAQAAVDGVNAGPDQDGSPDAPALTVLDVRPEAIVRLGDRLDDLDGFERHVVDQRQLALDSPTDYARFVALMQALPQADPQADGLAVLAGVGPGQIGVAVVHEGDRLSRAIVVSSEPPIHVDYAP
jgi:hypothetical protein